MSRPDYRIKHAVSPLGKREIAPPFSIDTPQHRIHLLKKERHAVRYSSDLLPELTSTCVDDPEDITPEMVEKVKNEFLVMMEHIFHAFVEERLHFDSQWPAPLVTVFAETQLSGNLDRLFMRGDAQQVPINLGVSGHDVYMEHVPLFMEWAYEETRSLRVMLNLSKSQFFVLHLEYVPRGEDGLCYIGGAAAKLCGLYGFSMDDLSTASRLRTVHAAFTPIAYDDDGELEPAYTALHDRFTQWSLCH